MNNENEMTVRGLKRAMADFIDQIGITADTVSWDQELLFMTGDGKTFEGMNRVKRYLEHNEDSDFDAFRHVMPNLEI